MNLSRILGVGLLVTTLVACSGSGPEPMLTGVSWQLSEFAESSGAVVTPDGPGDYTVTFNEDGSANIVADCNSVIAAFETDGSQLTIELGASTLVACDDASLSDSFTGWLGSVASYTLDGDDLVLSLLADAGTLRLSSGDRG
jgi:heat shock protein HslJ